MLSRRQFLAATAVAGLPTPAHSADGRLGDLRTLNTYAPFRVPGSLAEWEARRTRVREQLLVANGLWPLPPKGPLDAVVHGKVQKDGYTIEKMYFRSMPGHYVTGNLYRPATGDGKRPGVLFAHGHWKKGRFEQATPKDVEKNVATKAEPDPTTAKYFMQAIPTNLARMGMVVFQFDMVGYADSTAVPHAAGFADADAELRLQSAMGLQTWNCLRAMDFITSLPDVDPAKIGMTGASGGGTQTFLTGALDDRLAAAFPAVMVSATMQGGCVCENCSLLRTGSTNVEVAALFAPKPMAMSCADDWTKQFLQPGYGLPELKRVWSLYKKPENVEARLWAEYPHNYNHPAREFMYSWFAQHLLGKPGPVAEQKYEPLEPDALSVFDKDHPRPKDELPVAELRKRMTAESDKQFAELRPADAAGLDRLRQTLRPALRAMLCDELPPAVAVRQGPEEAKTDGVTVHRAVLGRADEQDAVPFVGAFGSKFDGAKVCVWVHPKGRASLFAEGKAVPAVRTLLDAGFAVVAMDVFAGKRTADPKYAGYTWGYNRTPLAERVHDILTGVAFARSMLRAKTIHLAGWGDLGPATVLARAAAGGAVAKLAVDLNKFDFDKVTTTADPMLLPGAVKYGGLGTFLSLAAPAPVLAYHAAGPLPNVTAAYQAAGAAAALTLAETADAGKVAGWLAG